MKLKRLGIFQETICYLISTGKTESIDIISDKIQNSQIGNYIATKYCDSFNPYKLTEEEANAIGAFFANRYQKNDEMDYRLANQDSGLLLLLAIIARTVENECGNWEI